jgi:hypothetical protein
MGNPDSVPRSYAAMTGLGTTIIPRSPGRGWHSGIAPSELSKERMLAIISRVYDRWTSFQFERQCRRLARGQLADLENVFAYLSQFDEDAACADALSWITDVLARPILAAEAEPPSSQVLRGQLLEAHRRLPTRQRRLIFLYVARGYHFAAFAVGIRMPQAQALHVLCSAVTRFRRELAAVEASRWPQR